MARKRRTTDALADTLFAFVEAKEDRQARDALAEAAYALADLRPDPDQPRQVLPADLAQRLAQGELTPAYRYLSRYLDRANVHDDLSSPPLIE